MDNVTWVSLPFSDERLESVVHFGNGKDAELELVFTGSRRVVLPASAVRIHIGGGVVVEVSSWDDVSLRTEYRAPDLVFHDGRIGFPAADDDQSNAQFSAEAREWLATGCTEELTWTVQVQLSLTSAPGVR